jgi:hypothetical protein
MIVKRYRYRWPAIADEAIVPLFNQPPLVPN